ncbi:MAG: trehalose-phosphatase [Planctomycetota bacterium]
MLANAPAETLVGHAVLEVSAKSIDKGAYVASQLAGNGDAFVLCAGDDRTDLDMFHHMPEHAFVVNIGGPAKGVPHTLPTPSSLRTLLAKLAASAEAD